MKFRMFLYLKGQRSASLDLCEEAVNLVSSCPLIIKNYEPLLGKSKSNISVYFPNVCSSL